MSDILTPEEFKIELYLLFDGGGERKRYLNPLYEHEAALRAVIQQAVEDVKKLPHTPLCDSWDRIEHENRSCNCGRDAAIANLKKGLGDK